MEAFLLGAASQREFTYFMSEQREINPHPELLDVTKGKLTYVAKNNSLKTYLFTQNILVIMSKQTFLKIKIKNKKSNFSSAHAFLSYQEADRGNIQLNAGYESGHPVFRTHQLAISDQALAG